MSQTLHSLVVLIGVFVFAAFNANATEEHATSDAQHVRVVDSLHPDTLHLDSAHVADHSGTSVDDHGTAGTTAHGDASHRDAGHGDAGHGEHDDHSGPPHLPSLAGMLAKALGPDFKWLKDWINPIYAGLTSLLFIWVAFTVYAKRKLIPGPFQNAIEMLVEGMYNFLYGVLGNETRKYLPFLGTIFFYILVNNLWGIIPLGHSPSTSINVTASLALCVFAFTQYRAVKSFGIFGYIYHLIGEPQVPKGWMWALAPALLVYHAILTIVHVAGEIAKPVSLALRLFGNITGEDVLVAAFVGLGITALAVFGSPIGLPLNVPFILLGLLLSTIQALVFTLLSTIYILMMLPHHSEDHH